MQVVCIGGASFDRKYRAVAPLRPGTSNPVLLECSPGGVARNVAENLARLGVATALVSIVGDDEPGRELTRGLERLGIDARHCVVSPAQATAEYAAILGPDGSLAVGLAAMAILDAFPVAALEAAWPQAASAAWIFADCNLPGAVLHALVERCRSAPCRLAIDAVSVIKAARLPASFAGIDLLFLNEDEAASCLGSSGLAPRAAVDAFARCGARRIVLTRGAAGLIAADAGGIVTIPAAPATIADVTGAGDALIAATLFRLLEGDTLAQAARAGTVAAALTIECTGSVRPDLSPQRLKSAMQERLALRGTR